MPSTSMYVNLPIKDLSRSVAFFSALGFSFVPKFTNENATCMIVDENIFVMLLVEPFFANFTVKEICDSTRSTEVILCLSCPTRERVDELVSLALKAGATVPMPAQDHGFMYGHGFQDLDGHLWELSWMSEQA